MSNKNLLNENTVRRFMKLAEIEPLTNQFVGKLNESDVTEGEDRQADDDVKEGRSMKDNDDVKEGRSMKDNDDKDGKLDEEMHDMGDDDDKDGMIDEELDALLAEMELDEADMQDEDEDEDMKDLDDELDAEEDLDDEPMGEEPMLGGMDREELRDMLKDVVVDALSDLVQDGAIEVSETEPEEVDVEADMMGGGHGGPMMEEEDMVNEVARRVMKRIINSRK